MQCNRVTVLIFEILIVHELRLRFVVQKNDGWVADLVGTLTLRELCRVRCAHNGHR